MQAKSDQESTVIFPVPLNMGIVGMVDHSRKMKERMRQQVLKAREDKDRRKTLSVDATPVSETSFLLASDPPSVPLSPRIPFDDLHRHMTSSTQLLQEDEDDFDIDALATSHEKSEGFFM
jgi:hypothetical protein